MFINPSPNPNPDPNTNELIPILIITLTLPSAQYAAGYVGFSAQLCGTRTVHPPTLLVGGMFVHGFTPPPNHQLLAAVPFWIGVQRCHPSLQ